MLGAPQNVWQFDGTQLLQSYLAGVSIYECHDEEGKGHLKVSRLCKVDSLDQFNLYRRRRPRVHHHKRHARGADGDQITSADDKHTPFAVWPAYVHDHQVSDPTDRAVHHYGGCFAEDPRDTDGKSLAKCFPRSRRSSFRRSANPERRFYSTARRS